METPERIRIPAPVTRDAFLTNRTAGTLTVRVPAGQMFESGSNVVIVLRSGEVEVRPGRPVEVTIQTAASTASLHRNGLFGIGYGDERRRFKIERRNRNERGSNHRQRGGGIALHRDRHYLQSLGARSGFRRRRSTSLRPASLLSRHDGGPDHRSDSVSAVLTPRALEAYLVGMTAEQTDRIFDAFGRRSRHRVSVIGEFHIAAERQRLLRWPVVAHRCVVDNCDAPYPSFRTRSTTRRASRCCCCRSPRSRG